MQPLELKKQASRLGRNTKISVLAGLLLMLVSIGVGKVVTAGLNPETITTYVEINGGTYGTFDEIKSLKDITPKASPSDKGFVRVTLNRDFVTDPSLYLWAKENQHSNDGLHDIHLVMRTDEGKEVSRYVLKLCQPLSWSLEAVDPALGGFHETIDLAVQEITIF